MTKGSSFVGKNRQHFESLESTHYFLTQSISKTNPPEGFCITTDFQSGGRGQIGRSWHSEAGQNVLVSYVFYPDGMRIFDQFRLTTWVSVAVHQLLVSYGMEEVKIKWPNDLYIGFKKVAGILIQNTLQGELIKNSVVSIGLNVNQTEFPAELPNPTSMALEKGIVFDKEEILDNLHTILEKNYDSLFSETEHQIVRQYYLHHLFGKNRFSVYRKNDNTTLTAVVQGVKEDGTLLLQSKDGHTESFLFHQIKWEGVSEEDVIFNGHET